MAIVLNNTTANTPIQGFGYLGKNTGSVTFPTQAIAAGGTAVVSTTITSLTTEDAATLNLIVFSGVGNTTVNNQNLLIPGQANFRVSGPPSYDVLATTERTTSGVVLRVQVYNPTGASQTPPTFTATLKTYYYTAPW